MGRLHDELERGPAEPGRGRVRRPRPAEDVSAGSTEQAIEALQRSVGNSAVRDLVTPLAGEAPARGAGETLPAGVRRSAERRLGRQLGDVRLHTGPAADAYATQLGADAVTLGRNIFTREGKADPGTPGGERTLMHELTHVAQAEGRAASARRVSQPHAPAEREAARVAQGGLAGEPTAVSQVVGADVAHRQLMVEEEELQTEVPPDQAAVPMPETAAPERETGAALGAPQPAGPASPLAALFDVAIIERVREARDHASAQPPNPRAAHGALLAARSAIKALASSYRDSNPLLHAKLWVWHNGLLAVSVKLEAMAGEGPTYEHILSDLSVSEEGIGALRDQLS